MEAAGEPIPLELLSAESRPLHVPDLHEAAGVVEKGLLANFEAATARVVECPDLRLEPTRLAAEGICGKPRLVEVGGIPNLIPIAKPEKVYDIRHLARIAGMTDGRCLVIGAGAGPHRSVGRCCEMMPNILLARGEEGDGIVQVVEQRSCIAKKAEAAAADGDGLCELATLPKGETTMSLMGNLLISQGVPGKVLEVRCRKRKGPDNFVRCIRKSLELGFPGLHVGLGGVFTLVKGRVKTHVMPGFSKEPLRTSADVDEWLDFYEMDAPFTCLSVLVSADPGLDLRLEHSHGYNHVRGQGGHYHCDTTPDTVEYLAYYSVAEHMYRVDPAPPSENSGQERLLPRAF